MQFPEEKNKPAGELTITRRLRIFGSGGRDRTADRRIMIPLLYQLSYAATLLNNTTTPA
jgi:hypothetical protein